MIGKDNLPFNWINEYMRFLYVHSVNETFTSRIILINMCVIMRE